MLTEFIHTNDMKKDIFIVIFLVVIMFSCTPAIKIGVTYKAKDTQVDEIIFNTDSTFISNYTNGFKNFYSEGSWHNLESKNEIVLESNYYDLGKMTIKVEEQSIDANSQRIDFLMNENIIDSILYLRLVVNEKLNYDIGYAKSFYLPDTVEINEFKVLIDITNMYHTPINTKVITDNYKTTSINSNYFKVYLPVSLNDFYYKKIENETIKVLNKKIKWQGKTYYMK